MGIEIPPAEVREHASDVDEAARMLDEARAAASYIRTNSAITVLFGVFSLLCAGAVYLFERQTINDMRRPRT